MSFTILIDVQSPVYDPNSQEKINGNDNDDNVGGVDNNNNIHHQKRLISI